MQKYSSKHYDLTQDAAGAIYQAAMTAVSERNIELPPTPDLWKLRRGLAESPAWMMVQMIEFDPEPVSVAGLRRRAVWSSPGIIKGLLVGHLSRRSPLMCQARILRDLWYTRISLLCRNRKRILKV